MPGAHGNPQTLLDGAFARRLERLTLVSRKRLVGQGQGDRRSLRKGSSLEFADYRHYVEGDDPARVDWNIYSRTDTLFVRLYEEEEVLNVHLLVDASRSMDWGEPSKLRYARRLAAALGYVALNASNRLFVWPLSASTTAYGPAWGRGRAGPMLSFMDDFKPAQATTPVLAGHERAARPGAVAEQLHQPRWRAGRAGVRSAVAQLGEGAGSPGRRARAKWSCCTRCRPRSCGRRWAATCG